MDSKEFGRMGGFARAAKMTPEERKKSASKAGKALWAKINGKKENPTS